MTDSLLPAEQRLAEGHLHLHVQVVAPALKLLVLLHLQGEDDVAWELAGLLLGHAGEGQLLAVAHALLDLRFDDALLPLALLLARHLLVLLHVHAGADLDVHLLDLVGAPHACPALGHVRLGAAATAHDAPLNRGLMLPAVVESIEGHLDLCFDVITLRNLALLRILHSLHAASVVQDLLVRVVQDLVRIPDGSKLPLGVLVRVLVRMVLDGQLPVDLFDLRLARIILKAKRTVEILVQLRRLKVEDSLELGGTPLTV
mmetsp:Transcript_54702/g.123088  ORF Transcript_54702/g.123088 Transcript_54702/m.123088 type:complete len:258 (+) Transcript_54702:435-1208(+)